MSATILTVIVLIVMWVVVLVPLLVRRAEESDEAAALWAPALADGGTATLADPLAENEPDGGTDTAWAAGRVGVDRVTADADLEDAATDADPAASVPVRRRPSVLARRRRALAVLGLLTLATAGAATVASPLLWLANLVSDALLLGYLTRLRAGARNAHRARELAREQARQAARAVAQEPGRQAAAARTSRPAQPAYQGQAGYGYRPVAPRPSQVIALDDEDPSFAQLDVRYPRAANE